MTKNHVYDFDISFKDIFAVLFRRNKKCLACGENVKIKMENKFIKEGWNTSANDNGIDVDWAKKYVVSINYTCKDCNKNHRARAFW